MNSEGYVERVHESGAKWSLRFTDYLGRKGTVITGMNSTCQPRYGFVSDSELMVSWCDPQKGWRVGGLSSAGKWLWDAAEGANTMWPVLVAARNGSRVAREMLLLRRSAHRYKRLVSAEDLLGQTVKIFDAAKGTVLFESPVVPVFDAGGNVAVSPSGRRVAILGADTIQIFDLPDGDVRVP